MLCLVLVEHELRGYLVWFVITLKEKLKMDSTLEGLKTRLTKFFNTI